MAAREKAAIGDGLPYKGMALIKGLGQSHK